MPPVLPPLGLEDRIEGCLLGMAAGDALGLPREGMSARRAQRLFGAAPLRHMLWPGHGMVSDDTEHAALTLCALRRSGLEPDRFVQQLAWGLRGWILSVPAGVGLATLRACGKLLLGWSGRRSGVWSAGNGPCMRAPIIGVMVQDQAQRRALVDVSTTVTHTDERALEGAQLVADVAACGIRSPTWLRERAASLQGAELRTRVELAAAMLESGASASEFAHEIGCTGRVSGYVNATVPVALFCLFRHPTDFRAAVESVILLGGDTDTTAAIVGGLAGATLGRSAIPAEWLAGVCGPVFTASGLTDLTRRPNPRLPWLPRLFRNGLLASVVLAHVFRRLLPPY